MRRHVFSTGPPSFLASGSNGNGSNGSSRNRGSIVSRRPRFLGKDLVRRLTETHPNTAKAFPRLFRSLSFSLHSNTHTHTHMNIHEVHIHEHVHTHTHLPPVTLAKCFTS